MHEIWTDIANYEGLYQVSNTGKVKSLKRGIIMKPETTRLGYKRVQLSKEGRYKHFFIHQLVARAFIPNPHGYPFINHKDENPSNNNLDNLEWCTQRYNLKYGHRNSKLRETKGTPHVIQRSLHGDFIAEYCSANVAAAIMGVDYSYIYRCLRGESESAYGYLWSYAPNQSDFSQ